MAYCYWARHMLLIRHIACIFASPSIIEIIKNIHKLLLTIGKLHTFHLIWQPWLHKTASFFPGKVDEKATQLHAIASLKVLLDATKPQNGAATSSAANHVNAAKQETMLAPSSIADMPNGVANALNDTPLDTVSKRHNMCMFWWLIMLYHREKYILIDMYIKHLWRLIFAYKIRASD